MSAHTGIIGVIPARLNSQRLAGKVLLPIGGRPMIPWVFDETLFGLEAYSQTDGKFAFWDATDATYGGGTRRIRATTGGEGGEVMEATLYIDKGVLINGKNNNENCCFVLHNGFSE